MKFLICKLEMLNADFGRRQSSTLKPCLLIKPVRTFRDACLHDSSPTALSLLKPCQGKEVKCNWSSQQILCKGCQRQFWA